MKSKKIAADEKQHQEDREQKRHQRRRDKNERSSLGIDSQPTQKRDCQKQKWDKVLTRGFGMMHCCGQLSVVLVRALFKQEKENN